MRLPGKFCLCSAGFSLRVLGLARTNPRRLKPALQKQKARFSEGEPSFLCLLALSDQCTGGTTGAGPTGGNWPFFSPAVTGTGFESAMSKA
jgi:hypothetical protein